MAQDSESRHLEKIVVRLPDGMRDRIKAAAAENNRSTNAEIVATLMEKYPEPEPEPTALQAYFRQMITERPDEFRRLLNDVFRKDYGDGGLSKELLDRLLGGFKSSDDRN